MGKIRIDSTLSLNKQNILTFINPPQSSSASKKVAVSTSTVPAIATTRLEAPYPLTCAFCSSTFSAAPASGFSSCGSGLWQCQKSIISAQFPLGRSFQTHPLSLFPFCESCDGAGVLRSSALQTRHEIRVALVISAAVQGT